MDRIPIKTTKAKRRQIVSTRVRIITSKDRYRAGSQGMSPHRGLVLFSSWSALERKTVCAILASGRIQDKGGNTEEEIKAKMDSIQRFHGGCASCKDGSVPTLGRRGEGS